MASKLTTRVIKKYTASQAIIVCLFALLVVPVNVFAGGQSGCKHILSFRGAYVNNYVKEFEGVSTLKVPEKLQKSGNQLSQLIQLDGLYSQIGYGPLGYVFIDTSKSSPKSCANENLLKNINDELVDKRGALLLSGNFQQVNDQIYLLTQLDFLRKGLDETISLAIPNSTKNEAFIVQLPMSSISFSPRKFSEVQMFDVFKAYEKYMQVRKSPSPTAKIKQLNISKRKGFAYSVEEVRDGWLKLKSRSPGFPSGWIEVPGNIGELGLRDLLPELYFVDAVAVYLQIRVGIQQQKISIKSYSNKLKRFESLLNKFSARAKGVNDRRALGLLQTLQIALILDNPEFIFDKQTVNKIENLTKQAAIAYPTSRETRSLMVLTKYISTIHKDEKTENAIVTLENELLKIISSDPLNSYAKANLERLWRVRQTQDKKDWQTDKIIALRERFKNDQKVKRLLDQ